MELGPVAGEFSILLLTCFVLCCETGAKLWSIGEPTPDVVVNDVG